MNIGVKIKRLREGRGWSQTRLLQEARKYIPDNKVLARETMSRIENGHRPPDWWVLNALAQALGTTAGDLIDGAPGEELTAPGTAAADAGDVPPRPTSWTNRYRSGDLAGLVERLELLPRGLRDEIVARLAALLDVLLNAVENVGLSENERELLRYLREASPEKQEAIHRLVAAAGVEAGADDPATAVAQTSDQAADQPAAE